ncbi:unnamed protein product [Strongylus vulgaris]|uniref:Uncharacterized protein n=1 Tax=Strongylus vulgaris TaxID=40348 RepID=A0A3P7IEP1_STRVU|nr:unnamed protein product [Strongylus vulgaris]
MAVDSAYDYLHQKTQHYVHSQYAAALLGMSITSVDPQFTNTPLHLYSPPRPWHEVSE